MGSLVQRIPTIRTKAVERRRVRRDWRLSVSGWQTRRWSCVATDRVGRVGATGPPDLVVRSLHVARTVAVRLARIALVLVLVALVAAPAQAQTLPYPYDALPGVVAQPNQTDFDPGDPHACIAGDDRCLAKVIDEMRRRFARLADACSHDAVFALGYLRVTELVLESRWWSPPLFSDRPFINHADFVFADYYFRAQDAWRYGGQLPEVWRVAFDAASERAVPASTNLLLGALAHIKHDLPFVLYSVGLTDPDGASRKPDYDAVNRVTYAASGPVSAEIARRFDPSISDSDVPGTQLDSDALFHTLSSWREQAWRYAEQLAAAPTSQARTLLARTIAAAAATEARTLRDATRYQLTSSAAQRDAFCAEHHDVP